MAATSLSASLLDTLSAARASQSSRPSEANTAGAQASTPFSQTLQQSVASQQNQPKPAQPDPQPSAPQQQQAAAATTQDTSGDGSVGSHRGHRVSDKDDGSDPQDAQSAATPAATELAIGPRVGTPDWSDALSQKVVFLSNAHQQSAALTLNPPDLGPLQVVLNVADNHAHALFVSQHPQVREAVEAALPKLREAMEAGGLSLGSANVSDGGAGFARQDAQRQASDASATRRAGGAFGAGGTGEDALAGIAATASSGATQRRVGMVDTFA